METELIAQQTNQPLRLTRFIAKPATKRFGWNWKLGNDISDHYLAEPYNGGGVDQKC